MAHISDESGWGFSGYIELTDIRTIDEAEEIQNSNGGHNHQINLEPQLRLGLWVELDQRVAISTLVCWQTLSL